MSTPEDDTIQTHTHTAEKENGIPWASLSPGNSGKSNSHRNVKRQRKKILNILLYDLHIDTHKIVEAECVCAPNRRLDRLAAHFDVCAEAAHGLSEIFSAVPVDDLTEME